MQGLVRLVGRCDLELVAWLAGLSWLALHDPDSTRRLTLCPLRAAGFEYCPGCGLGTAISHLFRGRVALSWQAHPLGIPAVVVLAARICLLLRTHLTRPRDQWGATTRGGT
jgi:hypothetical protein